MVNLNRLHHPDLGILFIRLALGVVFLHAGWLKVDDINMVVTGFAYIGLPAWVAYLVAYSELISGLGLILGLLVRYAGTVLSIIMLVAMFKVHWANGFGLSNNLATGGGYEYVFVLLLCSLAIITLGAGQYSLVKWIKK